VIHAGLLTILLKSIGNTNTNTFLVLLKQYQYLDLKKLY